MTEPQVNYTQPKPSGIRHYRSLIIVGIILLILGIIGYIAYSSQFRFKGIQPKDNEIGLNTTVVINFSHPISNANEVMSSIKVEPVVNMNMFVDGSKVVIYPLDSFEDVRYEVSIPTIKSTNSKEIRDFRVSFRPLASVPGTSEETNLDLDDIAIKKYPQLENLTLETNDYRIQYAFDGDTVIFDLYLIEPLTSDEDEAISRLKANNNTARAAIATVNIPKDKYVIRYQNDTQQKIIYGGALPPAN